MKPWDPPDAAALPGARRPAVRLVGARAPSRSRASASPARARRRRATRSRSSCRSNQVPYQWIDVDQDAADAGADPLVRRLDAAAGGALSRTAAIWSRRPRASWPRSSGLQTQASAALLRPDHHRRRSGRAGGRRLRRLGGPAHPAHRAQRARRPGRHQLADRELPRVSRPASGRRSRAPRHRRRRGASAPSCSAQEVVALRREDPYRIVRLADGTERLVLRGRDRHGHGRADARGARHRAAPRHRRLLRRRDDRGRHATAARTCASSAARTRPGRARSSSRATRAGSRCSCARQTLGQSMSQYLVDRIAATPNIEVLTGVEVAERAGHGTAREGGRPRRRTTRSEREIAAAAMFIFIGARPRTEVFAGLLELDEKGFILTGPDLPRADGKPRGWPLERDPFLFETSVPGHLRGRRRARRLGQARGGRRRRGLRHRQHGPPLPRDRLIDKATCAKIHEESPRCISPFCSRMLVRQPISAASHPCSLFHRLSPISSPVSASSSPVSRARVAHPPMPSFVASSSAGMKPSLSIPMRPSSKGRVRIPVFQLSPAKCTACSSPRIHLSERPSCARQLPGVFAASGFTGRSGPAVFRPRRSKHVGNTVSSPSSVAARSCTASPSILVTGSFAGGFISGGASPASPGRLPNNALQRTSMRRPVVVKRGWCSLVGVPGLELLAALPFALVWAVWLSARCMRGSNPKGRCNLGYRCSAPGRSPWGPESAAQSP